MNPSAHNADYFNGSTVLGKKNFQKFLKKERGVLLNYRLVPGGVRERIPTLTVLWLTPVHVTSDRKPKNVT